MVYSRFRRPLHPTVHRNGHFQVHKEIEGKGGARALVGGDEGSDGETGCSAPSSEQRARTIDPNATRPLQRELDESHRGIG